MWVTKSLEFAQEAPDPPHSVRESEKLGKISRILTSYQIYSYSGAVFSSSLFRLSFLVDAGPTIHELSSLLTPSTFLSLYPMTHSQCQCHSDLPLNTWGELLFSLYVISKIVSHILAPSTKHIFSKTLLYKYDLWNINMCRIKFYESSLETFN